MKQEDASYAGVVGLARAAIEERAKRQFIHDGMDVAAYLDPLDETVEDKVDDDQFIEQLAQSYAQGPDIDPDGPEVCTPPPISFPVALGAVTTVRSLVERQDKDYCKLIRQLRMFEMDMQALQVANRSQTTLESAFFIVK